MNPNHEPKPARKGKIARLPFEIREYLNHQLKDNVPVKDILSWLNNDPTVRQYMETLFQGRYITEQNISEWRQGGHQEWLTYLSCIEDVRDLSEDSVRMALTDISGEHILLALTAMFAQMVKNIEKTPEIAFNRKLIVVEHLIKTALSLRRSEQKDERLKLDRERLEILRKKGNKSPSSQPPSYAPRVSSYTSVRPCPPHPLHPKAPEIRRPPAPIDPDLYPGEPDWPPKPVECHKIQPDPDEPPEPDAGPGGPYAPSSLPGEVLEGARKGASLQGEVLVEARTEASLQGEVLVEARTEASLQGEVPFRQAQGPELAEGLVASQERGEQHPTTESPQPSSGIPCGEASETNSNYLD